ncbi:MAG: heme-binding domain-containing protein [Acidobacteria bacterium]|nr:heme-binding domain-containing protein [Acidobacteriota bacterium]MBW4046288.1 heme-binding domain-containing protein [Acidobacteriota bacterium]
MKRLLLLVALCGLAALGVGLALGRHPYQGWPPLPPTRPGADIAAVAHPPALVMTTLHKDCYNCHSDHPDLPWYGYVWPSSAQVQDDIHRAGARLNFSEWDQLSPEMSRIRMNQVCTMVSEDKMPIWYYKPFHPEAKVTKQQAAAICNWANQMPIALTTQSASR